MENKLRKTGIDVIGDAPWSSHFCQFYQTKKDLLDILVPYFKAGLGNNEYCMWVTSEPLSAEEAHKALAKALPGLSKFLKKGQIEIIPHTDWYLKGGYFDSQRVLNGWVDKLNTALEKGFDGLRLSGNTFWLEKKDWKSFTNYESDVTNAISKYKILALCTYSLNRCNALEVMDVIRNHEFALIKQKGKWEIIENSAYKITKQALLDSENKLRQLYSSMSEGVALHEVVYDNAGKPVDYIITDVNPVYEFITGLKRENVLGEKASRIYGTDKAPYIDIYAEVASGQGNVAFETFFPPMNKHFNISVFSPEEGQFATVFSDITARIQAEENQKKLLEEAREQVVKLEEQQAELETLNEELRSSQESLKESSDKYQELYDSTPVGYLTLSKSHFVQEANRTLADMLNVRKDLLIGSNFSKFISPEHRLMFSQCLARVFETGVKEYCELRMKKAKNLTFYARLESIAFKDPQGNTSQCRTTLTDITEQKKSEDQMVKIAKEWQATFDSIEDMVSIQDRDFKLIRVNKAYEKAVGKRQEELVGKRCFEIIHGSGCPAADCPHRQTLHIQRSISEELYEPRLGIYLEATTSPIFNENGEVIGTVHIAKNITERKKSQDRIKLLNESLVRRTTELEAANKELEAFSYSVSHDLRAPLRSINGFSQALSEDYQDKLDDQAQEYLKRIRNASQLMSELIEDLLSLSRATMSEMRYDKVNLSELAQQITTNLQNSEPHRQVDFIINPSMETSGDLALLRRALENLLNNAFKFTGKVPRARIEFGVTKYHNRDTFFVRDNGAGFDMAYAEKLFRPFQRLHPSSEFSGTGIGLALVNRIINRHGGKVWAEGKIGKGATFYFTL